MNQHRLKEIYSNIAIADKSDMENIYQMTRDFPYYHLPFVVLSKYYFQTSHYKFEEMLRQAALRVKDRKVLYDYIHDTGSFSRFSDTVAELAETNSEGIKETTVEAFLQFEEDPRENEQVSDPDTTGFVSADLQDIVKPEQNSITESPVIQDFLDDTMFHHEKEQTIDFPEQIETSEVSFAIDLSEPTVDHVQEVKEAVELLEQDETSQEFRLGVQTEVTEQEEIQTGIDIIGEEIETEFSFSHSFLPTDDEDVLEEESISSVINRNLEEELTKQPERVLNALQTQSEEEMKIESLGKTVVSESEMGEEDGPEKDFFAWLNSPRNLERRDTPEEEEPEEEERTMASNVNMDLIERFIKSNPQISRPKKEFFNAENMAKRGEVNNLDFVTETLADIYYNQGNYDLAINAYEKLSLQNPQKGAYFASLVEKIKKERNQ